MKWLILVLLVACGEKNPPARDVGDSDGDQILNYLEDKQELEKYTANIKPFGEVRAYLSFRQGTKMITVGASNESNLHRISYSLLTKREDLLKVEEHFSEWSKLRIIHENVIVDFPENNYELTLRFLESSETPDHVDIGDVTIGKFQEVMKFHLTGKELKEVFEGKISLTLKRAGMNVPYSESSTVRQKTYRVFWNDGKTSRVFYVSNELTFERFLILKKISQARNIADKRELGWTNEHQDWWIRNLGEKDKVIVKASEKDISLGMEKNFVKGVQEVQRSNGKLVKAATITKHPDSRLFLKFRGFREERTFQGAFRGSRRSQGSGEGSISCRHWIRNIVSSGNLPITSEDVLNNVQIQTENKMYQESDLRSMAYDAIDESGPYLEVLLDTDDQNFRITMPNRAESTFTRTGEYQWSCDGGPVQVEGGTDSNNEGHFTMRVDTYVEKLED